MLCSLAMPADYEVSPWSPYRRSSPSDPSAAAVPRPGPPARRPASLHLHVPVVNPSIPRRPCLVVRVDDASPRQEDGDTGSDTSPASPTKLKKKVVFADDAGQQLTHVKVMTEPSFAPPRWNMAFLAQVTRGATAEVAPEPWEATFPQPASDYLAFRSRLDRDSVSLENVIVREAEQVVVGTVKVRNLAFHKEVFIRSTSDDWATHEDAYCTYVNNGLKTAGVKVLYDTFSFRLPLPPQSRRLEFCVCFRCEDREYWDSNSGKNYVIVKKSSPYSSGAMDDLTAKIGDLTVTSSFNNPELESSITRQYDDALRVKMDSWSEFASWNHLSVDGPYW